MRNRDRKSNFFNLYSKLSFKKLKEKKLSSINIFSFSHNLTFEISNQFFKSQQLSLSEIFNEKKFLFKLKFNTLEIKIYRLIILSLIILFIKLV